MEHFCVCFKIPTRGYVIANPNEITVRVPFVFLMACYLPPTYIMHSFDWISLHQVNYAYYDTFRFTK